MADDLTRARPDSSTLQSYERTLTAKAVDALESAVGGREKLIAALTGAPATDDLAYVINLIASPEMDARKLSQICRAGRITVGELLEAYKRGVYAQMQVSVMAKVAEHTPAVVEDVLLRSQPHQVVCPSCKGSLVVRNPREDEKDQPPVLPCTACLDANRIPTGLIDVLPDLDRQKLALDLANLLPKKSPMIAIDARQQSAHFGDVSPAGRAKLLGAADDVLYRSSPSARVGSSDTDVVDATPEVDAEPPSP